MSEPNTWRILVVEDEPDGQEVAVGILSTMDIAADVVGTAEEALDLLEQQSYTAAVIDLALPSMDGLTLLKTLRSNPATENMPCMAFTAFHSSLVKKEALEAGCNAYLTKPIDDKHFLKELNRIITAS